MGILLVRIWIWIIAMLTLSITADEVWAQSRYSISIDGTEVTDKRTGLIWRRCSAGQVYREGACIGFPEIYLHEDALSYASSQPGWRLPNIKELFSIVDVDRTNPAIDGVAFPGTGYYYGYWSSTPSVANTGNVWGVGFSYGLVGFGSRVRIGYVRLVR